jgi:hypothetical protein
VKKFTLEIQRSTIVMANAFLKTIKHPMAAVLTKVTARVDAFLEEYPGDKYRLTAECIDDKRSATETDRESEEEQAEPAGGHHR